MYTYHMIFCPVFQESFAQMVKFQAIYQHICNFLYKKRDSPPHLTQNPSVSLLLTSKIFSCVRNVLCDGLLELFCVGKLLFRTQKMQ